MAPEMAAPERLASHRPSSRSKAASLLLAAALVFCCAQARAQGIASETTAGRVDAKSRDGDAKTRAAIEVEGNRRVDAETVRSYFHAAADGRFDEASRDAALKSLVATGLFDQVSIERAGERLVVHVHEAPVLDRVAFEGNKRIKDDELTKTIESKPRGTLQRAQVQSDVSHIMEAYRHLGRDEVGVRPEIIDRGNDR